MWTNERSWWLRKRLRILCTTYFMQMDKTRVWHRPEWTMFPIYLCLLTAPRKRVCQRAFNDSMFAVTNNDKIFSWQRELSSDPTLKTGWVLSTYSGKYNCEERFNNFLCCWRFSPPSSVSFQKRILIRYKHRSRSETRTRMGGNNSPPTIPLTLNRKTTMTFVINLFVDLRIRFIIYTISGVHCV